MVHTYLRMLVVVTVFLRHSFLFSSSGFVGKRHIPLTRLDIRFYFLPAYSHVCVSLCVVCRSTFMRFFFACQQHQPSEADLCWSPRWYGYNFLVVVRLWRVFISQPCHLICTCLGSISVSPHGLIKKSCVCLVLFGCLWMPALPMGACPKSSASL